MKFFKSVLIQKALGKHSVNKLKLDSRAKNLLLTFLRIGKFCRKNSQKQNAR